MARSAPPPLLPILRSQAQGRLLAALAEDPSRAYGIRELAHLVDTSPMTVQREVDRAEAAGLVTTERRGSQRLVRIDSTHYLYGPLRQLLLGTFGVPAVVAELFSELDGVAAVVVYGSWAARYHGVEGKPPNDVDVLLVGDAIDRDEADDVAERAEGVLGLPVQVTVRGRQAWDDASDGFLATVRDRAHLIVVDRPRDKGAP